MWSNVFKCLFEQCVSLLRSHVELLFFWIYLTVNYSFIKLLLENDIWFQSTFFIVHLIRIIWCSSTAWHFFHFSFITGRRRHMGTRLNKLALYISIFILFTSSGLSGKSKVIVFSSEKWIIFTFGFSTKEFYTLLYELKEYLVVI